MKALFIYDCVYPESLGGVELRNYCLAQALTERGHSITVAGWTTEHSDTGTGGRVIAMPYRAKIHDGSGRRSVAASLRFAAAVATLDLTRYDAVETAALPYLHLFVLRLRCALARKPLIVTWYEFFGGYWRQYTGSRFAPVFRAIEWVSAQIGIVNASSPLTAGRLQTARIFGRAAVPVLPCGVWLRSIRQAAEAPAADVPPLFYAGRLIPEKRVDLLLAAVARVRAQSPTRGGPLLGIAGAGPDRSRLERRAAELGVADDVIFYGRLPEISDMWALLAGARVAVQPSAREGFGLFPLEALALGRPVVICEGLDNAVTAFVRDGIEGLCCAATPEGLALTLQRLLDDPALWSRLSDSARQRANNYDWTFIAEQFEALVATVVPQPPISAIRNREDAVNAAQSPSAPRSSSR